MACTGVYRVSALAYYVVMEHSTIFTRIDDVDTRSFHRHGRDIGFPCLLGYIFTRIGDVDTRSFNKHGKDTGFPCLLGYIFTEIGDVDTRSFHRHDRDTSFPCLLGYNKQERPPVVDHYIYKHFTYSYKLITNKKASIFTKSFRIFYSKASKVF